MIVFLDHILTDCDPGSPGRLLVRLKSPSRERGKMEGCAGDYEWANSSRRIRRRTSSVTGCCCKPTIVRNASFTSV